MLKYFSVCTLCILIAIFRCLANINDPTQLPNYNILDFHAPLPYINFTTILYTKSRYNLDSIIPISTVRTPFLKNITYVFLQDSEKAVPWNQQWKWYGKPGDIMLYNRINNFTCKFYIYNNCYIDWQGEIYNGTHAIRPPYDTGLDRYRYCSAGKVDAQFNNIVMFSHRFVSTPQHFFHDVLSAIIFVPNDIMMKSTIVIYGNDYFTKETMEKLGYGNKVFYIYFKQRIFAHKVLVQCEPRPHNSAFGPPLNFLHKKMREKFNVEGILPTRFCFMNRNCSQRKIGNFNELFAAAKHKFPIYDWEIIPDRFSSMEESAKVLSTVLFLFTPAGSNTYHSIFMMENSVVVICGSDHYDHPAITYLCSMEIRVIYYFNMQMKHTYNNLNNIIGYYETLKAIETGLFYIKNNYFPEPVAGHSFVDYIRS